MKRFLGVMFSLVLVLGVLSACGKDNNGAASSTPPAKSEEPSKTQADKPAQTYKDGVYFAEGDFDPKSGWKEIVALKVEGGKIVSVNWNGLHKDGGMDKKYASTKGQYPMVEKGGAKAAWHEQTAKAEKYLIDKQDPKAIVVKDDGKTDAITGVSIDVGGFVKVAAKALDAGPVKAGPYKDGTYHAESADFDAKSGWKETVDLTVVNGKIAAVRWNGVHKDGGTDKFTRSKAGEYGMKKGGAQAEWHEETLKAEKYLLEKQDPKAIVVKNDGKTDAITGVSITVSEFVTLAAKALEGAK